MSDLCVTAAATGAPDPTGLVVVLVVLGLWIASLWLHPWTRCFRCKGVPRLYGAFATRSFRLCPTCGGRGRRLRVGVRTFTSHRD